jgi:hypothetical protein
MNDNETYTITLSEDVTLNLDSISSNTGTYNIVDSTMNLNDITYSTSIDSTIAIEDPHWADSITWESIEFEDSMPSVSKVEDMCKDYPALNKAYENFKTIYAMVHQDWKGKQDEEETPF